MTSDEQTKQPGELTWKSLLSLAWPLIIANSFWNLQLTVDRIFLGAYSTEALGAAMAVMGVFWVPMALLQQTASYVTAFVAQYLGAREPEQIGASVWQSLYVSVFGGIAFLALMLISDELFAWIAHPDSVRSLEVEYFDSLTYSALPTALVAAVSGFFTGLGQTRKVIWINFSGLILNAILDYVMIAGRWGVPAMGVAGAGYATAIGTYGSAVVGLALLFNRKNENQFRLFSSFRLNWNRMKPLLRFGIPSGLQWAFEGLAFTVFLVILGRTSHGEAALASSSIAVTLMMLSVLPSMGVAQGVMTLVGQNLGAGRPDRAETVTWIGVRLSLAYMSCVAVSFFVIPELYLFWFQNDNNALLWKEVADLAVRLLQVVAVFTIFDSVYLNVSFALKGAGDTKFVSLLAMLMPWPLMVWPAYAVKDWPDPALWAWRFAAVYAVVLAGVLFWRFRQGRWKSLSVIHPSTDS